MSCTFPKIFVIVLNLFGFIADGNVLNHDVFVILSEIYKP